MVRFHVAVWSGAQVRLLTGELRVHGADSGFDVVIIEDLGVPGVSVRPSAESFSIMHPIGHLTS